MYSSPDGDLPPFRLGTIREEAAPNIKVWIFTWVAMWIYICQILGLKFFHCLISICVTVVTLPSVSRGCGTLPSHHNGWESQLFCLNTSHPQLSLFKFNRSTRSPQLALLLWFSFAFSWSLVKLNISSCFVAIVCLLIFFSPQSVCTDCLAHFLFLCLSYYI